MGKFLTQQNYRDLFDLVLDEEYTLKEIAEKLHLSVPTIRMKREMFVKAGIIVSLGKVAGRPTFGEGKIPFAAWWLQSKGGKIPVQAFVRQTPVRPVVEKKVQTGHIEKHLSNKEFEEVLVEKVYNVDGDRYIKIEGELTRLPD